MTFDPRTWVNEEFIDADTMNSAVRDALNAIIPNELTASTFTPTLTASTTNPTMGTAPTLTGRYMQIGKLIVAHAYIQFGSTGAAAGSGTYRVALPVAAHASVPFRQAIGSGKVVDASVGTRAVFEVRKNDAVTCELLLTAGTLISDSNPWVWANSDVLTLHVMYEAA